VLNGRIFLKELSLAGKYTVTEQVETKMMVKREAGCALVPVS
jgi:hypothetical protein